MEHEGVFNSGRAAGDLVGSGSTSMERDRTRSLLMGQLGSGGGLVDGGSSSMERSHNQPMVGLGLGSAMAQDARTGFGASRPQAGQVMEVHPTVMGLASMKLEGEAVPQRSKKHKGCNEGQLKEPGSIRDFYLKQD